jgi:molybdopterin converting factor small subunit
MTVNIQFLLYLESFPDFSMGKRIVPAELDEGSTFGALLKALENSFGSALAEEVYDPQKQSMHENVLAIINGVLSHNLDGADTILRQGDKVVFVPLITGG